MAALAEGTRGGGTRWTSVYAIFPNVTVMSKAAIAAGVISHGNGGLERLERMEVVTSTRRKGERWPLIVLREGKDFHLWNNPPIDIPATNFRALDISDMAFLSDKTPLAPLSSAR
jgi:hypothetical protein